MRKFARDRRRLLKNSIKSAAALPFLQHLPSLAANTSPQKRFIMLFTPNGTIPEEFFPSGSENQFEFNSILAPLESVKSEINIYKGLDNKLPLPGDDHQRGMGGLWTARHLLPGDTPDANGLGPVGWASGVSVDQVIAQQIGGQSRFKSLEYGVACGTPDIFTRQSYSASEVAVEPEMDPYAAFKRLYGNQDLNLDQAQQRNLRLKSVLDAVIEDFNSISPRLSAADKQALERHTQSVRELEQSLQTPDLSGNCLLPDMGARLDVQKNENIPHIGKLFMDLMVSALACEQSNVLSLQWTRGVSDARFVHLGINGGHHDMSHELDSNSAVREQLIKINTWYGEQFAYLVNNLKDTPDPSGQGSLLDNTFVIWGNELGKGNNHTRKNIPFVSAGNLQGSVSTGRYLRYSNQNHASLLAAMANLYGTNLSGFGDYANASPLSNLA